MNNETTNDEKIERYRDGLMSPGEREEFERQLAGNEQLRRSLRIDEAMTMALAIDRSAAPNRHAEMRTRALDAIARIAPAAQAATPMPVVKETEGAGRSGRSRGLFYTGLALLLLGIGGWLLLRPTNGPAATPVVSTPAATEQAPAPTSPQATPAPAATMSKEDPREVRSMRGATKDSGGAATAAARSSRHLPTASIRSTGQATTRDGSGQTTPPAETKPARKPPVIRDPKAVSPIEIEPHK